MPTDYLKFYTPDFVFSLAFFIGFIGFGLFFSREFWPWLRKHLDKQAENNTTVRLAQLENVRKLTDLLEKLQGEIVTITELQRYILQKIEGAKWPD